MMDEIIGKLFAFKGDNQYADQAIRIEVTSARKDGVVELAFDTALPGKPRFYVSFRLADMLEQMLKNVGESA